MMYLFSYQLLLSVNEFSVFNSPSFEIFRRQGQNEVEIKWGQKILVYSTIYVHSEILFSTCMSWSHCLEVYMHLIIENELKRTCNLWFVQWNWLTESVKASIILSMPLNLWCNVHFTNNDLNVWCYEDRWHWVNCVCKCKMHSFCVLWQWLNC